ncbi:hypothetical protein [Glutamicibacter arilaitensis]|uniref:hypothetical protein n=1 Tax=Glutamicibacter arilaitensis TaxID=256701 RepID=UPI003F8E4096
MATQIFRIDGLLDDSSLRLDHNPNSMTSFDAVLNGETYRRFDSLADASEWMGQAVEKLGGSRYVALCAIADHFDDVECIYVQRDDGHSWLVNEHEWNEG